MQSESPPAAQPGDHAQSTTAPVFEQAHLSFHQGQDGRDWDTAIQATLATVSGTETAYWSFYGQPFDGGTTTGWFAMATEYQPLFDETNPGNLTITISPNGNNTWWFDLDLLVNWTGGCDHFRWPGQMLSDSNTNGVYQLKDPPSRIQITAPLGEGASVSGITTLIAKAALGPELEGIEFAIGYTTLAGSDGSPPSIAWFSLGGASPDGAGNWLVSWDTANALPQDMDRRILQVNLCAIAVPAPGSTLWANRLTPRAYEWIEITGPVTGQMLLTVGPYPVARDAPATITVRATDRSTGALVDAAITYRGVTLPFRTNQQGTFTFASTKQQTWEWVFIPGARPPGRRVLVTQYVLDPVVVTAPGYDDAQVSLAPPESGDLGG